MRRIKKGVILCVDDDSDVLDLTVTVLESEGYKTVCAEDGIAGFELFEKHKKKLWGILTDAHMPRMNGLDFARKVRESGSDVPIMLVTAYMTRGSLTEDDDGVTVEDYHAAGINAHIEKPFSTVDLLHAIEIMFDSYGRKRSAKKRKKRKKR